MERCLHPRFYAGRLFPCGKCPCCLSVRRDELATRLYVEACASRCSYFITLTYEDDSLPFADTDINCFDKQGVQAFIRSIRDFLRTKGISVRYFLTSEYGDIGNRSHYHMLLYLSDFLSLQQVYILFSEKWQQGLVYVTSIGIGAAKYVSKYCLKDDGSDIFKKGHPNKPFRLFSRRPGLGATPKCIKYFEDIFGLSSEYIYQDENRILQNVQLAKKVPRVIRDKLPEYVQRKITAVGWSKFFAYKEELVKSLYDRTLNYFDGKENLPIFDRDEEIKASARRIRKLKKNCL